MSTLKADVIDELVGIEPGSRLDAVRAQRLAARTNAQQSYLSLFAPNGEGNVSLQERFALGYVVAGLHQDAAIAAFYRKDLALYADAALIAALDGEIASGVTTGPYGQYPAGPLTLEDKPGLLYSASDAGRAALGDRLAAALAHVHLLVFRPRDASPAALDALLAAGWSSTDIVTLSQLVAFLSFQIRVIVGLRALKASLADAPAAAALSNA